MDKKISKFEKEMNDVYLILREHRIGKLLKCIEPNFENPKNPVFGKGIFEPGEEELFENILFYASDKAREYGSKSSILIEYDSSINQSTLIIKPDNALPRNAWYEETTKFLNHFRPHIKHFERL